MKRTQRILSIISILSLAVFANCGGGGGNETPAEKVQLQKLVKTWKLKNSTSATLNNVVADQIDPTFTLTISGTFSSGSPEGPYAFSVSGTDAPSPWQPSGKWFFGTNPKTQLIRDEDEDDTISLDDIGITYNIDSNGELTLTFACPEGGCQHNGAARVNNVQGAWKFVMIPN